MRQATTFLVALLACTPNEGSAQGGAILGGLVGGFKGYGEQRARRIADSIEDARHLKALLDKQRLREADQAVKDARRQLAMDLFAPRADLLIRAQIDTAGVHGEPAGQMWTALWRRAEMLFNLNPRADNATITEALWPVAIAYRDTVKDFHKRLSWSLTGFADSAGVSGGKRQDLLNAVLDSIWELGRRTIQPQEYQVRSAILPPAKAWLTLNPVPTASTRSKQQRTDTTKKKASALPPILSAADLAKEIQKLKTPPAS